MSDSQVELPRKMRRLCVADDPEVIPDNIYQSLNDRLKKMLSCKKCSELPHPNDVFLCSVGHIICEGCAVRNLADAVLTNRDAQCPHCRIQISWSSLKQNVSVQQAVGELVQKCPHCGKKLLVKHLKYHQENECPNRLVRCKYHRLGCTWRSSIEALAAHEASCGIPHMTADQLAESLCYYDVHQPDELQFYADVGDYQDFTMHIIDPMTTREHAGIRLRSDPVEMHGNTWHFYMRLEYPDMERRFSYNLGILQNPRGSTHVKYFIALLSKGMNNKPLSDLRCVVNEHTYTHAGETDPIKMLPITLPTATYRLIAMPEIRLRIWMTCAA